MKRERQSERGFPFNVLGVHNTVAEFALANPSSELHTNVLDYLSLHLESSVVLEPQQPGPYLLYPDSDDVETQKLMESRLREQNCNVSMSVNNALCGLCEPICLLQCVAVAEGRSASLSDWSDLSAIQQLTKCFEPLDECGIGLAPWMLGSKSWAGLEFDFENCFFEFCIYRF
jgi:hypothetical protein